MPRIVFGKFDFWLFRPVKFAPNLIKPRPNFRSSVDFIIPKYTVNETLLSLSSCVDTPRPFPPLRAYAIEYPATNIPAKEAEIISYMCHVERVIGSLHSDLHASSSTSLAPSYAIVWRIQAASRREVVVSVAVIAFLSDR